MPLSARRRLTRIREQIVESGTLYDGWLGVVIRARLKCRGEGIEPPSDEAILAEHWGVSPAEVNRRLELHAEYIATYHPDLQARLEDPDLPRRLAEVDLPIRPDGTNPPIP